MSRFLLDLNSDGGLHIIEQGMTNHALRAVLIGLWLSMDETDRIDHIKELGHYAFEGGQPPGMSVQIGAAIVNARDRSN